MLGLDPSISLFQKKSLDTRVKPEYDGTVIK